MTISCRALHQLHTNSRFAFANRGAGLKTVKHVGYPPPANVYVIACVRIR